MGWGDVDDEGRPRRTYAKRVVRQIKPRAPKAPRRAGPEADLQIRIVNWCRQHFFAPPEGPCWTAVNPVPSKTLLVAQKSKAMGMQPGVGDFLLVWRGRPINPEFKAEKGGRLSPAQLAWQRQFTLAGGLVCTIKSLDEWIMFIDMLGIPLRREVLLRGSAVK